MSLDTLTRFFRLGRIFGVLFIVVGLFLVIRQALGYGMLGWFLFFTGVLLFIAVIINVYRYLLVDGQDRLIVCHQSNSCSDACQLLKQFYLLVVGIENRMPLEFEELRFSTLNKYMNEQNISEQYFEE